jgi:hypothetical protein
VRRIPLSLIAAAALLLSCEEPQPRSEPAHSPLPRWDAPSDYDFVVGSRCGEQSFIGTFRISVRNGKVERAEGLDESAASSLTYMSTADVPSLEDLVGFARRAREAGADVAEVVYDEEDGHPTRIDIDYRSAAIDDESCFVVSKYRPRA